MKQADKDRVSRLVALGTLAAMLALSASCAKLREDPPIVEPPPPSTTDAGAPEEAMTPSDATVAPEALDGWSTPADLLDGSAPADVADETGPIDAPAPVCTANRALRCEGNALISCNASGTGTSPPFTCPAGCNVTRLECNVCVPSGQACTGARLDACRLDGAGLIPGTCSLSCLPAGACCSDLDCGRCNQLNPCRRCGPDNRCQDSDAEPSCSTQGACTAESIEICTQNGATCEVRKRRDNPCRYQLCRWSDVSFAACGMNGNRGIPTLACSVYSFNNPGTVPAGQPGACASQVENLTGAPYVCL